MAGFDFGYATRFRLPVGADLEASGWRVEGGIGFGAVYPASAVPTGPRGRGELTHMGEDWNLGSGNQDHQQPVYAVANGTVAYVGSPSGWQGQVVVIRHDLPPGVLSPSGGNVVYSVYAHLEGATLVAGDEVRIGQQIARLGLPSSFSAHLHFEMRDSWGGASSLDDGYALNSTGAQAAGDRGWFDPEAFIRSNFAATVSDDYAGSTNTMGRLAIGSHVWGVLESSTDRDWFRVELAANTTYRFALRGVDSLAPADGAATLGNPTMRLRDANGNEVYVNGSIWQGETGGGGRDASQTFTTGSTGGVFYINAYSSTGDLGSYRLSAVVSSTTSGATAGADSISGSSANNSFDGLGGNDTILGNGGNDTILGGSGNDSLYGGTGNDSLSGGLDADRAYGGSGDDRILGGDGNDSLFGETGNDAIRGDAGNDVLYGGSGNDTLYGDAGRDAFVFNSALGSTNVDVIVGFSVVDDTIYLEDAIFARLSTGTLTSAAFARNTTGLATDSLDRIIYETDTGRLYYDADGTGTGSSRIHFATVATNLAITQADFLVY